MKINVIDAPRTRVPEPQEPVMLPAPRPSPVGEAITEAGATAAAIGRRLQDEFDDIRLKQFQAEVADLAHAAWYDSSVLDEESQIPKGYKLRKGEQAFWGGGHEAVLNSLSEAINKVREKYPQSKRFDASAGMFVSDLLLRMSRDGVTYEAEQKQVIDEDALSDMVVSLTPNIVQASGPNRDSDRGVLIATMLTAFETTGQRTGKSDHYKSVAKRWLSGVVRTLIAQELDRANPNTAEAERLLNTPWLPGGLTGKDVLVSIPGVQEDLVSTEQRLSVVSDIQKVEAYVSEGLELLVARDYDPLAITEYSQTIPAQFRARVEERLRPQAVAGKAHETRVQRELIEGVNSLAFKTGFDVSKMMAQNPKLLLDAETLAPGTFLRIHNTGLALQAAADAPPKFSNIEELAAFKSASATEQLNWDLQRLLPQLSAHDQKWVYDRIARVVGVMDGTISMEFTQLNYQDMRLMAMARRMGLVSAKKPYNKMNSTDKAEYDQLYNAAQAEITAAEIEKAGRLNPTEINDILQRFEKTAMLVEGKKVPLGMLSEEQRKQYAAPDAPIILSEGVISPNQQVALSELLWRRSGRRPGDMEIRRSAQQFFLGFADRETAFVMRNADRDFHASRLIALGLTKEENEEHWRIAILSKNRAPSPELVTAVANAFLDNNVELARRLIESAPLDVKTTRERISGAATAPPAVVAAAQDRVLTLLTQEPQRSLGEQYLVTKQKVEAYWAGRKERREQAEQTQAERLVAAEEAKEPLAVTPVETGTPGLVNVKVPVPRTVRGRMTGKTTKTETWRIPVDALDDFLEWWYAGADEDAMPASLKNPFVTNLSKESFIAR